MRWFGRGDELERELRRQRPQPRRELVATISGRVHEQHRRRPVGLRLGFAAAFSAVVLVGLALVGGLGYAAGAVQSAARTAEHAVTPANPPANPPGPKPVQAVAISSADTQYKVAFCKHYGDRKHKAKTILISSAAVPAHLKHDDPGSHVGACTPADFGGGSGD